MDKEGNKTGGRQKGTPNKVTKDIREAFRELIEGNLDNLNDWLEKVAEKNPEKAMDIMIRLSEYIIPKLNRSEVVKTTPKLTKEQRRERIKELLKKAEGMDLN